jgi:GT2 family glycosyltransferase
MSPQEHIRLTVIVPVYNNWTDTMECLHALQSQSWPDFQTILADDGSPTPPPEALHRLSRVSYLRGPNLGFAGNCNRAAEVALQQGATHLLLLNNDTHFSPDFIAGWCHAAASHPGGILSPTIYYSSAPNRVWYSGGDLSLMTPFARKARQYPTTVPVEIICGCAFLIPAAQWRTLGGFDRGYPMYFEDFDLMLRAKSKGIPVYLVPDAAISVWHKVSGSFREAGFWGREYRLIRARLTFIRMYYQGLRRITCYALAVAHFFFVLLANLPDLPQPRLLWQAILDR